MAQTAPLADAMGPGRSLPVTLDHFGLEFRLPADPRAATHN